MGNSMLTNFRFALRNWTAFRNQLNIRGLQFLNLPNVGLRSMLLRDKSLASELRFLAAGDFSRDLDDDDDYIILPTEIVVLEEQDGHLRVMP